MKVIEIALGFLICMVLTFQSSGDLDDENCPEIIGRKKWASRSAKSITYQTIPVKYVIIHHTVTSSCDSKLKCSNILLGIQNFHMDQQDGDDIPYK